MRFVSFLACSVGWLFLGVLLESCGDGTVTLAETENRPPRILVPPLSVLHDSEYRETVRVLDPDGDSLNVRAIVLPSWMTFDPSTRVLSGAPGVDRVGPHRVKIRAYDGVYGDTVSFLIEVVLNRSGLTFQGPWTVTGYRFGHDGLPYPGESFVVYSDFSAQEERRYLAEVLDGHFQEIKASLGVRENEEMEGWTPGNRIDVLSLRAQADTVIWMGTSFRYGFIVHSPDSRRYSQAGYTRAIYDQLLRHELMHVVEYYLTGSQATNEATEKWFHEGVAMVMGGEPPGQLSSLGALNRWRQEMAAYPGQGNPVFIKSWQDYPPEIQANAPALNGYYLAFELAVRYLLDPVGLGKSWADVRAICLAIGGGTPFAAAFEAQMGLSLERYESEFWGLMGEYLE